MTGRPTVTIVVNTFNQAAFLPDSLGSCLDQRRPAEEIIVIDDGSTLDDPAEAVAKFRGVRLVKQANRGLSGARNAGLALATSQFILFLDADDQLTPDAVSAGVACLLDNPDAGLVYGAHRNIDEHGRPSSGRRFYETTGEPTLNLLRHGNFIGMHATVMYRRKVLVEAGGFDETLRACEDYDLFLRLGGQTRFVAHDTLVAEYRKHSEQMSTNHDMMKRLALEVIDREVDRHGDIATRRAAKQGRRNIERLYTLAAFRASGLRLVRGRAMPGDFMQAVKAFAAFPGSAMQVMLQKSLRHAQNDVTVRL